MRRAHSLALVVAVACCLLASVPVEGQCLAHSSGPGRVKASNAAAGAKGLNRARAIHGFPLIETGASSALSSGCAACIAAHEPSADSKEPEPCWFCPSTGECRPLSHALLRPLCPARWRGSAPPSRLSEADLGPVSWKASCSDKDEPLTDSQSHSLSSSASGSGSVAWPSSRKAVAAQQAAHLALAKANKTSSAAPHLEVVPIPRSGRAESLDSELLGPADLEGEEDHSHAPPIFDKEALAQEMLRHGNKSAIESTATALRALNGTALLRLQTLWFAGEAWARLAGALSATGKGAVTPAGLQALMLAASALYGIPIAEPAAQTKAKAALTKLLEKHSVALLLNSTATASASASSPSSASLPHVSADTERTFPFRLLSELLALLPDALFAAKNHKGSQLLRQLILVSSEAVDRAGMVVAGEAADNPKAGSGHGSLVFFSNSWRDERLFSLVAMHELGHLWEKSMRRVDPQRHARLVTAAAVLKAPAAMPYIWPLPDGTRKGRMAYLFGDRTNEPLAEAFCLYVLQGDLLRSHIRETRAQADLKNSAALRAVFAAWDTLYSELKRSLGKRYPDWEWAAYSAARPQPAGPKDGPKLKTRRRFSLP